VTGGKEGESTTFATQTETGSITTQTGTSQSRSSQSEGKNTAETTRESGNAASVMSLTTGPAKVTGNSGGERLNMDLIWTWSFVAISAVLF